MISEKATGVILDGIKLDDAVLDNGVPVGDVFEDKIVFEQAAQNGLKRKVEEIVENRESGRKTQHRS